MLLVVSHPVKDRLVAVVVPILIVKFSMVPVLLSEDTFHLMAVIVPDDIPAADASVAL